MGLKKWQGERKNKSPSDKTAFLAGLWKNELASLTGWEISLYDGTGSWSVFWVRQGALGVVFSVALLRQLRAQRP